MMQSLNLQKITIYFLNSENNFEKKIEYTLIIFAGKAAKNNKNKTKLGDIYPGNYCSKIPQISIYFQEKYRQNLS